MLEKLKTRREELLFLTGIKVQYIEEALNQELPAYSKMGTEIDLNGLSVLRGYKPFNDSDKQIILKGKIKGLERKLKHSEEFLLAINNKNEYLITRFDLFREIGSETKDD